MSAGTYSGFDFNSFCTSLSAAVSSFGFSSKAVNARNFLASAACEGSGSGCHDFLHGVPSFIHFSQAISRPRQIVQDRRIVLTLASGFLQKTVRPGEIAALVRDLSKNAGDLGISWRELARFLCVSESFLLVLERSGIELCKLGYGCWPA